MLRILILLFAMAGPLAAEQVVVGLSQSRISITTNFDGSEILIFGAVKREAAIPSDAPLHVIITVAGPSEQVSVRRKERRFGIWVNTDEVVVDSAPSFYAVATSGAWNEVISDAEDLLHRVSIRRGIYSLSTFFPGNEAFIEALMRIRERKELYQTNIGAVQLDEQTLFSTSIRLPANLTEGDYSAQFYLTRNGTVIDSYETRIPVQKVGLERFLYRLSRERPLIYGLLSIAIAIFAGWGASAVFRMVRN